VLRLTIGNFDFDQRRQNMDTKRIVIGTLVGAVVLYVVGYLLFQMAFASFYATNHGSATGVDRDVPVLWAMVLANVSYAALLTLCLAGRENASVAQGFVIGGIVGFLAWFTADFSYYSLSNMWTVSVPIVDPLLEFIHAGIGGAVIAAVLARVPKGAGMQPAR